MSLLAQRPGPKEIRRITPTPHGLIGQCSKLEGLQDSVGCLADAAGKVKCYQEVATD